MGAPVVFILSFVATVTAVTLLRGVLAPHLRLGPRVVLALALAVVAFAAPLVVGRFLPTRVVLLVDLSSFLVAAAHFLGVFTGFILATQLGRRR